MAKIGNGDSIIISKRGDVGMIRRGTAFGSPLESPSLSDEIDSVP